MNDENSTSCCSSKSPADKSRGRLVAGGVLLVVALGALAGPHLPWAWGGPGMMIVMGVAFVVWAALARTAGLLVPGGVILGVGTGLWLRGTYGPAAFLLSLAGGFLLISVLSLALFGRGGRTTWWTVWPAGGLTVAALATSGGPEVREFFRALRDYWPYALLVVALALIASGLRRRS